MIKRSKETQPIGLRRELSLWQATLCGVGIILGAGIYVLVGEAAGIAGNAVWLSFLLAAIVASLTGLSYAELSSMFPKASGEYLYSRKAFGRRIAFIVGWLLIISQIVASAAVALGFSGYFLSIFFPGNEKLLIPIAMILISLCGLLLFKGIKDSANVGVAFTLIEALGLILIIAIGVPYFGSVNYFDFNTFSMASIFGAAALVFFAYIGFDEIVQLAEETKKAERNIPMAVLFSIMISTVLYMLVAISAISVVPWQELALSKAPLAMVASTAFGAKASLLLALIALFSTANTVLLVMLSSSRLIYGMANIHSLPRFLAKVHEKNRTPHFAILAVTLLTVLFSLMGEISKVASLTNYTIFIVFISVNAATIALRYLLPKETRKFRIPLNIGRFPIIPALGLLTCIVLLVNIQFEILLYGSALLIFGAIVFEVFIKDLPDDSNAS